MVTTKKNLTSRTTKTTKPPVEEELLEISEEAVLAKNEVDLEDYESKEKDTVRIFTGKRKILPGVEIDIRTFRVYLTDDKETYLEFREPDTGECLETIKKGKEKSLEAAKKGKIPFMEEDMMIKFICSLSIGEIPVTNSLIKSLPIKYQYRIIRTIEYITEAQNSKLGL